MNDLPKAACPGCGHPVLKGSYALANQPVLLNYRFHSVAAAQQVRRRDMRLTQCARCGLIFNATFSAADVPYDENYDNRQCFSGAFNDYLEGLARELILRHGLQAKRILEVGCGKGDFLRTFCRHAAARGVGYDTTFDGGGRGGRSVRFHQRYVAAADVKSRFDAVLCRHVIEHVGEIGGFLRDLHAIASAAGDPVVILETPRFEWIAEHVCFWDIFYEHCNYFTMPCLAHLCALAGFNIVAHQATFGGQYQVIELRCQREAPAPARPNIPCRLPQFARAATQQRARLERRLVAAGAERGWAVWGAGAKGVALVNQLPALRPRFVIDSNQSKQGCVIPGSDVAVVSPADRRILALGLILIANPNYRDEITAALRQAGFTHSVATL